MKIEEAIDSRYPCIQLQGMGYPKAYTAEGIAFREGARYALRLITSDVLDSKTIDHIRNSFGDEVELGKTYSLDKIVMISLLKRDKGHSPYVQFLSGEQIGFFTKAEHKDYRPLPKGYKLTLEQ